jgi:hypothetical protein
MDAKQPLASDLALGGDGRFPQTAPSVDPTSDFGSPVLGGSCVCPVPVGRSKQDVVDALGIRLHVAAKALEHLADGGAGILPMHPSPMAETSCLPSLRLRPGLGLPVTHTIDVCRTVRRLLKTYTVLFCDGPGERSSRI